MGRNTRPGGKRSPDRAPKPRSRKGSVLFGAALAIVTIMVYSPVTGNAFIDLDDDVYIWRNPMVMAGISWEGLRWAFTTFHESNWHPLTWISHMLDVEFFGVDPQGAHLVNLVLHILNSLLVFVILLRATNAFQLSALVSVLFAVHPMHVESVAWAAERKDVLSAFFGLLTILFHVRHVLEPAARKWYFLGIGSLAMGLLCKPMLVSIPLLLLLMDYWPLARLSGVEGSGVKPLKLVREKLPHAALVLASMVITIVAQKSGGAMQGLENIPFSSRLSNMVTAYASYIGSFFRPASMAIYYPHPIDGIAPWKVAGAIALLISVSAVTWLRVRRSPYLFVGWIWFLLTLVPVIGLVQVGGQSMADRYTYMPYIGLAIIVAWGADELRRAYRALGTPLVAMTCLWVVVLAYTAHEQVKRWKDSSTVFAHALSVTDDNIAIEFNFGVVLARQGRPDLAVPHFANAIRISPRFYDALFNMGLALASQGRIEQALDHYRRAASVRPESAEVPLNIGAAMAQNGRYDEALEHLEKALKLDPRNAAVHTNIGLILLRRSDYDSAMGHFREAVALDPNSADAQNNIGLGLLLKGSNREAEGHFAKALELDPDHRKARENLQRSKSMHPGRDTLAAP